MSGELFPTITPVSWRRGLAAARARRVVRKAEVFARARCPLCGQPGRLRVEADGVSAAHANGLSCWVPGASGPMAKGGAA
jgi:hypothetical protein